MASLVNCACGWMVLSPFGPDDVKKHMLLHVHDLHPGMAATEDEIRAMIKTV